LILEVVLLITCIRRLENDSLLTSLLFLFILLIV